MLVDLQLKLCDHPVSGQKNTEGKKFESDVEALASANLRQIQDAEYKQNVRSLKLKLKLRLEYNSAITIKLLKALPLRTLYDGLTPQTTPSPSSPPSSPHPACPSPLPLLPAANPARKKSS
jgi:hypothetical protein